MIFLESWGNAWTEHRLDPEIGAHRLRWRPRHRSSVHGFGSYEPIVPLVWQRFYAVYCYNERLIFQAGRSKWDLTEGEVRTRFKMLFGGLASRLAVEHNGQVIHRAWLLHPLRALSMRVDPTFDAIDAENEHFLLFLGVRLPDVAWRKDFISWRSRAAA